MAKLIGSRLWKIAIISSLFCGAPAAHATLWGLDSGGDLYTLDNTSGATSFVVSTGLSDLRGLSFDPTTGRLYSAYGQTRGGNTGIVEIDLTTGVVTNIGGTRNIVSLAFDDAGQLYGAESPGTNGTGEGNIFLIDKATGAEMLLGNVDSGNDFGPALAFNWSTGELYFKPWEGRLLTVDTVTGVSNLLGTLDLSGFDGFNSGASGSFQFDPDGNMFVLDHPCCGTSLLMSDSNDLLSPALLGDTGLFVRGLAWERSVTGVPSPAILLLMSIGLVAMRYSSKFNNRR